MKKFLLVDGNSLLFRAFYALPLLATPQGEYTNAVYGFAVMLKKLLEEEQPTHVLIAFDKARQTFRNQIFVDYKGTRKETPAELVGQFALVREFLTLEGIPWLELGGYEADDLLGVYSQAAEKIHWPCMIVTGDRDALQLVTEKTQVYLTKKGIGEIVRYAPEDVRMTLGVQVEQVVDLKALMGDTSDNIPGVPGVGAKTAAKLLNDYGDLQGVYQHMNDIKGKKLRENLATYQEQAYMSRKLAEILRELPMPLPIPLENLNPQPPKLDKLKAFFARLQFKKFLEDVEKQIEAEATQESLLEFQAEQEKIPVTELQNAKDWAAFSQCCTQAACVGFWMHSDSIHPMLAKSVELWLEADGVVAHAKPSILESMRPWLEDAQQAKILHNAKWVQVWLLRRGITLRGIKGDFMLLTYVMNPAFDGEILAEALHFHQRVVQAEDFAGQTLALRSTYQAVQSTLDPKLQWLLEEMELPISQILGEMEFQGVRINPWILQEIGQELERRIWGLQEKIYEATGAEFNILSPKQLGKVLFEDMKLPTPKKTKSGYSTGAEVLEKLQEAYPVVGWILEYRKLTKLKSTYIDALPQLVHRETGKIHTLFRQALTATGRLSSVEPNLQNIPIREEEGRRIRRAFVPSQPGWMLFSADYSQIDLRALAHISGDEQLIRTFREGVDIHARTASEIFGVPLEQVDDELRRRAKAVNFGIVYGISGFGLAKNTGVGAKEAGNYIRAYLQSYPGVQQFMEQVVEEGKKSGYVETLFGRRRYLPELQAVNRVVQSNARRIAWNTPVQGTSADIIKLAMLRVAQEGKQSGLCAHMLLQVHDELLFEVKKEDLAAWAELVQRCMTQACSLQVPLEVTLSYGENWYDMHKISAVEELQTI